MPADHRLLNGAFLIVKITCLCYSLLMSEYASNEPLYERTLQPVEIPIVDDEGELSLELERQLDDLVDKTGMSYADARARLGIDIPVSGGLVEGSEHEPLAVDLRVRAFALESLMAYYNQLNKTRGASTQRQLHVNDFDTRYRSDAPQVERNMYGKLDNAVFEKNIEILTAADAMRQQGFDEDQIELEKVTLKSRLNQQYGPHNAYAPDRVKMVNSARKAAGMSRTSKIRTIQPVQDV